MPDNLSFEAEPGELTFLIPAAPPSLQAAASRKGFVRDLIKRQTIGHEYLLSGDVQVDIEWMLNERRRYESHVSPDVDNVLKPALDALCGPSGAIIDDCQVQAVSCRWVDWTRDDEQFEIRIRFFPDELIPKSGLVFVHMGHSLCFPFDAGMPAVPLMAIVVAVATAFNARDELVRLGVDYHAVRRVMPIQRLFNRARIATKFPVQELPAFMRALEGDATRAVSISGREADLYREIEPKFRAELRKADLRFA